MAIGARVPEIDRRIGAAYYLPRIVSLVGLWCHEETGNWVHTRDNDRVSVAGKLNCLNLAVVPAPSSSCNTLLDIPKEDLAITAYAGEARIVRGNCHIEDAVAMGFVSLDRRGSLYRGI